METNNGTSYDNRPKGRSRAPLNQNLITASNENQNEKIEELTDEQLKQVAGGRGWEVMALITCVANPLIDGCVNKDSDCNCTECLAGYALQEQYGKIICVQQ